MQHKRQLRSIHSPSYQRFANYEDEVRFRGDETGITFLAAGFELLMEVTLQAALLAGGTVRSLGWQSGLASLPQRLSCTWAWSR